MNKQVYILAILISFSCGGCELDNHKNDNEIDDNNNNIELSVAGEQIVNASNDFSFNIFSEFEAKYPDDNIFFSPLSISIALSMSFNGGKGDTKNEIKEVIDFGSYSDKEINEGFKFLQDELSGLDENVKFSIANSAWYRQDLSLLDNYKNILFNYYYAEIEGLDFSDSNSKDTINEWIAEKTEDKIKNMIERLDPATVLVLVNAIYFNGTWKYEFDEENTYTGIFNSFNNNNISCDFMKSGKIKTKYVCDNEKTLAVLPYGNGNFEMVLYMPKNVTDMATVLSDLSANNFNSLYTGADEDSIVVHLPKFKIETETISIREMLQTLGMEISFTPLADFSNIFGSGGVYIDDVLHKAFIDVNEEGTEAAAATVVIFLRAVADGEAEEKVFYFNKPFLFFIREQSTGEILFAGKMINPVYN